MQINDALHCRPIRACTKPTHKRRDSNVVVYFLNPEATLPRCHFQVPFILYNSPLAHALTLS